MSDRLDPSGLPAPLDLLPIELLEKWSISDDVERDLLMAATPEEELRKLVAVFTPTMFDTFNGYLVTNPRRRSGSSG